MKTILLGLVLASFTTLADVTVKLTPKQQAAIQKIVDRENARPGVKEKATVESHLLKEFNRTVEREARRGGARPEPKPTPKK